jgi:predicted ATPase
MPSQTFRCIHPKNFLSFGPGTEPIQLTPLNVLIGPNGSGKSNLIEVFELLKSTAGGLADVVRSGGGAGEWVWKGSGDSGARASVDAEVALAKRLAPIRYSLEFAEVSQRLEVTDEAVENVSPSKGVSFFYRYQRGHPAINARRVTAGRTKIVRRQLQRRHLDPQQSVLSQRRDPDMYPEITAVADTFKGIATYREWAFGRNVALRQPQRADLENGALLPDLRNLGLVLNSIEQTARWKDLNEQLARFLPRFERLSTKIQAGHVQLYLHEDGLAAPIPATRLSDGTIRFIALLAILLRPEAASLICIEEPELGLHPDALALLAPLLVQAAETTQLVVTTHSDALVSALSDHADSVLVAEHLPGGTALRRLDASKLQSWLDKYRLGDVWRMGEIGGNL